LLLCGPTATYWLFENTVLFEFDCKYEIVYYHVLAVDSKVSMPL
jgi:hypothetical protein